MEGEVLRDDQWEQIQPFCAGRTQGASAALALMAGASSMRFYGSLALAHAGVTCRSGLACMEGKATLLSLDRSGRVRPVVGSDQQ